MNEEQYFLQELKNTAYRRGANLNDLFLEYDRNETGLIEYNKFRTLLSSISFWCNEEKLQKEIDPYLEGKNLNYRRFMQGLTNSQAKIAASDVDLKRFGQFLKDRGTCVLDIARALDQYRSGRVSIMAFYQATFKNPLTKTVIQPYIIPGTDYFEYVQLARDIHEAMSKDIDISPKSLPKAKIELPPYFPIVAQVIREQGIDIYSALSSYDRFHQGKISSSQFLQELSQYRIPLIPREFSDLAHIFALPESPSYIDYRRFCEEIKNEKTSISLRRSSNSQDIRNDFNTLQSSSKPDQSITIEKILQPFIGIDTKRLINQFHYDDYQNTGYVVPNAFFKTLSLINLYPNPFEREVLKNKYMNPQTGRYDYNSFISDLCPQEHIEFASNSLLFKQLVVEIKQFLYEKAILLRPILIRLDKVKTGKIPIRTLCDQLRGLQFNLTSEDEILIFSQYGELIPIEIFTKLVDPTSEQIQTILSQQEKEKALKEKSINQSFKQQQIPDQKILQDLALICLAERKYSFDLRQEFRVDDPLRKGTVKSSLLENILLSLPPSSELANLSECIHDLISYYGIPETGEIRYEDLCLDKSKYGDEELEKMEESRKVIEEKSQIIPNHLLFIIKKIKGYLQLKRMDIFALFQSYDSLHLGELSNQKFKAALKVIAPLSNEEIEELFVAFPKYRKLCEHVNNIELTKDDLIAIKFDPEFADIPQRDVENILISIYQKLTNRRRRVIDSFTFAQEEEIPVDQFIQAIMSFNLVLTTNDIQLLIKKYRGNLNGDIRWRNFCNDVEKSRSLHFGY